MIGVCEYKAEWPRQFAKLRDEIWPAISKIALRIEHVGSTAVEGMFAKPIIDIDIVIDSVDRLPDMINALAGLGYLHRGNLGIEGREAFGHASSVPHHLYVCIDGCVAYKNHILLRDHLRKNKDDRDRYSAIKRQLAKMHATDIDSYVEGKTAFILSVLEQYNVEEKDLEDIKNANSKSNV